MGYVRQILAEIEFERIPLRRTKFDLYPWSSLGRKNFSIAHTFIPSFI